MGKGYRNFLIFLIVFCLLVAGGCLALHLLIPPATTLSPALQNTPPLPAMRQESQTQAPEQTDEPPTPEPEPIPPEEPKAPTPTDQELAQALLQTMELREKVYQLFFVTPESLTGTGTVTMAGETTRQALKTYPVGGLIYFADNLQNREQTISMLTAVQTFTKTPLFLGVDEEGGRVSRVASNPEMGTMSFEPMATYGETGDTAKVESIGRIMGQELTQLGFNVNFAPVADIVTNPANTEIGDRAFSDDPQVSASMVAAMVKGLQSKNILSAVKHFPGHGSTAADSHEGRSVSQRQLSELAEAELLPFAAGIRENAAFVMVSHMSLPNVLGNETPCDLSYPIVTELLRNALDYQGLIITDSHSMGSITQYYTSAEAAVLAIEAGIDMILMPENLEEAAVAIIRAVENGELSESRINESVLRILETKYRFGILQ